MRDQEIDVMVTREKMDEFEELTIILHTPFNLLVFRAMAPQAAQVQQWVVSQGVWARNPSNKPFRSKCNSHERT